jgi:hypothetical protein
MKKTISYLAEATMKAIPFLIFIKTTVERLCIYIHLEKAESKAQKHDQMCRQNCITQKQLCIKKGTSGCTHLVGVLLFF